MKRLYFDNFYSCNEVWVFIIVIALKNNTHHQISLIFKIPAITIKFLYTIQSSKNRLSLKIQFDSSNFHSVSFFSFWLCANFNIWVWALSFEKTIPNHSTIPLYQFHSLYWTSIILYNYCYVYYRNIPKLSIIVI